MAIHSQWQYTVNGDTQACWSGATHTGSGPAALERPTTGAPRCANCCMVVSSRMSIVRASGRCCPLIHSPTGPVVQCSGWCSSGWCSRGCCSSGWRDVWCAVWCCSYSELVDTTFAAVVLPASFRKPTPGISTWAGRELSSTMNTCTEA